MIRDDIMPIRVIRKANGTPNFHFGENMWNDMLIREIENKDSNIIATVTEHGG